MKIYIAGPMTGLPDCNRAAFNRVAKFFESQGHIVLNPAILPDGLKHHEYMEICIPMLMVCERVVLLPGWEKSRGAVIERFYAERGKLDIKYWEDMQ